MTRVILVGFLFLSLAFAQQFPITTSDIDQVGVGFPACESLLPERYLH